MLLPLIGEGRDGECPARDFVVTPASEPESPSLGELKLFSHLQSVQLCDSETAALAINGYGYAFHPLLVLFRVTTPHSNSLPIGRENKMFFTIRPTMRLRVAFGLFGLSENSSFPSTLRAWFAFAHSSPPTGMTKESVAPHPSPPRVGEGILQIPFSS